MKKFGFNPFASLFTTGPEGKVVVDDERAERVRVKNAERRAKKKPRVHLPFVLQAFDGETWKSVYNNGELVLTRRHPKSRNMDLTKVLKDKEFVKSMKIQVFGKQNINTCDFYKTPIRWRRIDMISLVTAKIYDRNKGVFVK